MFLRFHCRSPARPIACHKLLGNVLQLLDGVVFGTVAISSDDIFYVAILTDMSFYFIDCLLARAMFGRFPLRCVRNCFTI